MIVLADGTLRFDTKIDSGGFETGLNKLKAFGKAAGKATAAAIGAAAGVVVKLTKDAVGAFSDYEQLVGGSQLLFGEAYDFIAEKAKSAYSTVQMSQNDYLRQVNGFSTGLKTALGGNEKAAAELADRIINAEADVVAATGASQEAVQNAFNGIMKSNYTMLDNLQLGITPTKKGMEEVIEKVNEWNKANGRATKYEIDNLADVQSALVDYIEMQGLAGYAANEAAGTIQGSFASLSAAWQNLMVGLADDSQNFDDLLNNVVDTALNAFKNIEPRIESVLTGIGKLLEKAAPIIAAALPGLAESLLPSVLSAAMALVNGLVAALPSVLGVIAEMLPTILTQLLTDTLPQLAVAGILILRQLGNGITASLPELVSVVSDAITKLGEWITSDDILTAFVEKAISLVHAIADGLMTLLPTLLQVGGAIVLQITNELVEALPLLLEAGGNILLQIADGIISALPTLIPTAVRVALQLAEALTSSENISTVTEAAISLILALGQGLINTIPQLIAEILPQLIEAIPVIISNIVTALIENAPLIFDAVLMVLEQTWELVTTSVGSLWSLVQPILAQFTESASSFFSETIPTIIDKVGEFFDQLPEKIAYGLGFAIGKLIAWGQQAIAWAATAIPQLINNIGTFFSQLPSKIWQHLQNAWQRLKDFAANMLSTVQTEIPKICTQLVGFFKDLPANIREIGTNIVKGLWEGIKNRWNQLKDDVNGLFGSLVAGIKAGLGIASPSKVFASIGRFSVLGMEKGIADSTKYAVRAMERLEDELTDATRRRSFRINSGIADSLVSEFSGAVGTNQLYVGGGFIPGGDVNNSSFISVTQNFYTPTATPSQVARAAKKAQEVT